MLDVGAHRDPQRPVGEVHRPAVPDRPLDLAAGDEGRGGAVEGEGVEVGACRRCCPGPPGPGGRSSGDRSGRRSRSPVSPTSPRRGGREVEAVGGGVRRRRVGRHGGRGRVGRAGPASVGRKPTTVVVPSAASSSVGTATSAQSTTGSPSTVGSQSASVESRTTWRLRSSAVCSPRRGPGCTKSSGGTVGPQHQPHDVPARSSAGRRSSPCSRAAISSASIVGGAHDLRGAGVGHVQHDDPRRAAARRTPMRPPRRRAQHDHPVAGDEQLAAARPARVRDDELPRLVAGDVVQSRGRRPGRAGGARPRPSPRPARRRPPPARWCRTRCCSTRSSWAASTAPRRPRRSPSGWLPIASNITIGPESQP